MFESDNTRKLKTEGGNMAQRCIAVLHPLCVLCYYFLKYQPDAHQTDNVRRKCILHFCQIYFKNPVLVDGRHLAVAIGQRAPWSGRARARRQESWQQEGEGSHKVATQSSRLACLSRVNITPRLHTVMTNRGGRAQKHYQDYCLVLPDPTHAIRIISQPLHF